MSERSLQDLLTERRLLVMERERDTDRSARALLAYYIASIDAELRRRREAA